MKLEAAGRSRQRIIAFLRTALMLGLMAPPAYAVVRQWSEVQTALVGVDWAAAIAGSVVLLTAQPFIAAVSWVALRYLKQDFPFLKIASVFFISQAAKYLPGGIWAFPSRVVAYRMIGVERDASVISLVQEVAALFVGAAAVGVAGLFGGLETSPMVRMASMIGVIVCCAAVLIAQHPAVWRFISRFTVKKSDVDEPPTTRRGFDLTWLPPALLAAGMFWLLVGWGFQLLAVAVAPETSRLSFIESAGIFSLAWCAGFVVVIAPSGLGVRESALAALLLPYMPLGTALSLALFARLWWTFGEVVFILLSLLLNARKFGT